ncbi:MAG TPA: glycosyltransferase family 4 protein [Thermoanaerobaculia bacterium]
MPRLLFVTGTPADVRGGSGTYVGISVLKEAIEASGHTVDLIAPERSFVSLARRLAFNLAVRGEERRRRPDVVVGFDLDGLFLASSGAPHFASIKGVIVEEARFEQGVPRLRLTVESWLERIHVRRSAGVFATSRYAASRIATDYGVSADRITIVPEPIDLARWGKALGPIAPKPPACGSILCVAHLYPRKDVATLLAAMTRLKSDAVLAIVGTGPERARLERRSRELGLGERVTFLGHVSFERLAAEYRTADVFCLPSRQEGFGIVFLEAMAAGLPVVAARAAAVPEVIEDGECGILVPPGDHDALAAALDRLLGDATERQRLGFAGTRRVARFDAPRVAEEFLKAVGIGGPKRAGA